MHPVHPQTFEKVAKQVRSRNYERKNLRTASTEKNDQNLKLAAQFAKPWQAEVQQLHYWDRTSRIVSKFEKSPEPNDYKQNRKYVTFEDDTGGWNNIRMAFETFVVVAKLTKRTLVIPPPCRFYLLDRGPIKVFEKEGETYSTYSQYFDLEDVKKSVEVITTDEFLDFEAKSLEMPSEIEVGARGVSKVGKGNGFHTDYFLWLRKSKDSVIWPTGPRGDAVFDIAADDVLERFESKMLHFPMHVSKNMRYLDGVPGLSIGRSRAPIHELHFTTSVKQWVRDHIHYQKWIVEAAAYIIHKIGGVGEFNALHIRRNDLQYKDVFVGAEVSLKNVVPLLGAKQGKDLLMYVATDETEKGFFDAFKARGIRMVQLGDFNQDPEYEKIFHGVGRPRKFEGMVEQLVCAASKVFVGTPSSTFTSYINRLRKYLGVEHDKCWYHIHSGNGLLQQPVPCSFEMDVYMGKGLN